MDCIDCHNTVGHPISPTPEQAVDRAIASGMVSRDLPFARREGLRLVKASYPSQDAGRRAIDAGCGPFTSREARSIRRRSTDRAALQALYRRNVFPDHEGDFGHLSG